MARPQKEGLDYFSHDVDLSEDLKIELIEAEHEIIGYGVYLKILEKIYKNGYYLEWSIKQQKLFSKRVNVDINTCSQIVDSCLEEGLFDKRIFSEYEVLTSSGIQKRYATGTSRRNDTKIIKEYLLVEPKNIKILNKKIVIVDINKATVSNNTDCKAEDVDKNPTLDKVNDDTGTQSKVKESKVKESKEKKLAETSFKKDFLEKLKSGLIKTRDYLQSFPEPDLELDAIEVVTFLRKTKNPNSKLSPQKNEVEKLIHNWLFPDSIAKDDLIKLIKGAATSEFEKKNLTVKYILNPEHTAKLLMMEEKDQTTSDQIVEKAKNKEERTIRQNEECSKWTGPMPKSLRGKSKELLSE